MTMNKTENNTIEKLKIRITKSRRKTLSLRLRDGMLDVRAPIYARKEEILSFIRKNTAWIEKQLIMEAERQKKKENINRLSMKEINELADRALKVIPDKVRYYAEKMGVQYGNITIRNQRTRWGSCSSKGNLNFNCLLMLTPDEVIDSVVVHELAHRKEMNHSKRFYEEVLKVCPDYYRLDRWLKENGPDILARMTG